MSSNTSHSPTEPSRWVTFSLRFPAEHTSAHDAREQIAARLTRLLPDATVQACAFSVGELVTNAVRYGLGHIDVRIVADATQLSVEIFDEGRGFPEGRCPRDRLSGLGLVERSVTRWGHTPDVGYVWFEIDVPPGDVLQPQRASTMSR